MNTIVYKLQRNCLTDMFTSSSFYFRQLRIIDKFAFQSTSYHVYRGKSMLYGPYY